MRAPAGAEVGLFYDGRDPVAEGDYLRTGTGRTYLIVGNRIQARGKHTGRQHLRAVVMADDHAPELDAVVHTIAWYRR